MSDDSYMTCRSQNLTLILIEEGYHGRRRPISLTTEGQLVLRGDNQARQDWTKTNSSRGDYVRNRPYSRAFLRREISAHTTGRGAKRERPAA